jgi:nucleotide-binding universal stress UspA family protein
VSTLLIPSSGATRAVLPEDWPSRVVVAADGRASSDLALLAARTFTGSSAFRVVTVLPGNTSKDRDAPKTPEIALALVARQLRRVLGDGHEAWIEMRTGYPPAVLASFAELQAVPLLIVGIGEARVLDRLVGDEFVLRLARMVHTPLFVTAPDRSVPPRRIVVATDFTETSMRAARLALALAAPDAELFLTHVQTPAGRIASTNALRRQADALQTGFCGRVRPIDLGGDAPTELLAFANVEGADAIAIGTHGEESVSRDTRGTLGIVATRVIRCSACSLIVAPRHSVECPTPSRAFADGSTLGAAPPFRRHREVLD